MFQIPAIYQKGAIVGVLLIETIFVLWKLRQRRILIPKKTGRMMILLVVTFILLWLSTFLIVNFFPFTLSLFFIFSLLFPYIFLIFANTITLPFVHYQKNKLIQKAIQKSEKNRIPVVVWVTGSYGKSSVKEFLSSILEHEGNLLKTPENVNTELGVSSLIVNKLNDTYYFFVAEMGAYKTWEIEVLWKIVNHTDAFVTAIGQQHRGLFWSLENTKKAKMEIAKKVYEHKGTLYLNYDNENIQSIPLKKGLSVVRYGISGKNLDAISKIMSVEDGKTVFEFHYKWKKYQFITNLIGSHNILNLTGVIAFCLDKGITSEKLSKYLLNMKLPKNTTEISKRTIQDVWGKQIEIISIDDTYNLSEEWLFAGVEILKSFWKYKKILILDDVLELWNIASKVHKEIGEKLAKETNIDGVYFVGENYKKDVYKGLKIWGYNQEKILENIPTIQENTVLLFEGRGSKKVLEKLEKNFKKSELHQ